MTALCLFDLDDTLLPLDSDHAWGEFAAVLGWVDGAAFRARNDAFFADYRAGTLDIHAYVSFSTRPLQDRDAATLAAAQARFMREVIAPRITPAALAVATHQVERRRPDLRRDHLAQEARLRGGQRGRVAHLQRLRREGDVGVDVERAGAVVGEEGVVAGPEGRAVDPAQASGELAPGMVGVERQQRVVEVEEAQVGQAASFRAC